MAERVSISLERLSSRSYYNDYHHKYNNIKHTIIFDFICPKWLPVFDVFSSLLLLSCIRGAVNWWHWLYALPTVISSSNLYIFSWKNDSGEARRDYVIE